MQSDSLESAPPFRFDRNDVATTKSHEAENCVSTRRCGLKRTAEYSTTGTWWSMDHKLHEAAYKQGACCCITTATGMLYLTLVHVKAWNISFT